jgi:hypothetical protein
MIEASITCRLLMPWTASVWLTGNQGIGAKEICRLLNWVIAIVWTGMKKLARPEFR